MRVESISNNRNYTQDDVEVIKRNLKALAKQHNTDVEGLLKSAHAAENNPLPYQVRALNMEARLNKLQGE